MKNLPVYRLQCELFEYSDEDFDTGIIDIDKVELSVAAPIVLNLSEDTNAFIINEEVTQNFGTHTISGTVSSKTASSISIINMRANIVGNHSFEVSNDIPIIGADSNETQFITSIDLTDVDTGSQSNIFEASADEIIDFSEGNPFGEP